MPGVPYECTYRRALLDMHIPDWDPAFMSKFDPGALASAYQTANLSGAMIYCKSHVGLTYWPAPVGRMHPGLAGRDVVGELVTQLHDRDISVCAYHSVSFDNWAWHHHQDWQVDTGAPSTGFFGRVGTSCLNNSDYRAYEVTQVADLAGRYPFDAFFVDIAMWPGFCTCAACRARYQAEEGRDIPRTCDWQSPEWTHFQRARERWSAEFCGLLRDTVHGEKPGLSFYSNGTVALIPVYPGRGFDSLRDDSFAGADRYGAREDQMLITKVLGAVVPTAPPEYITGRVNTIGEHVDLASESVLTQRALAAVVLNSSLLFTDCVNPDGTINPGVYERMGRAYTRSARYEAFLGGSHIEQVGVYFSERALVDAVAPARELTDLRREQPPHMTAWRAAAGALQRAHIPFGAVTRFQLDDLDRFDVIVLPNVQVLGDDEVAALRGYVERGGRLYASSYTGLVSDTGQAHPGLALADVFGVRREGDERGRTVYLKPEVPDLVAQVYPQDYLSHMVVSVPAGALGLDRPGQAIPRLTADNDATTVLARLSLPFGHPDSGSLERGGWSSIHNDPPWTDTAHPMITENAFGAGTAIYSAVPLELKPGANEQTFVWLVRRLMPRPEVVAAQAHPTIWVEAYDQPGHRRLMVAVLNYQEDGPPVPTPVTITVRPPSAQVPTVRRALTGEEITVTTHDGGVTFAAGEVEYADMFLVEYP